MAVVVLFVDECLCAVAAAAVARLRLVMFVLAVHGFAASLTQFSNEVDIIDVAEGERYGAVVLFF